MQIKLSHISTDPDRFQFRDAPFSEKTVAAIVAEGIDLSKFDPLPVFASGNDFIIAGDGHSRFEAIRQLDSADRLPKKWRSTGQTLIPCRLVSADEARTLAWTANLSRCDFTPCEEAKVFQAMLDSGMPIELVASAAHKSEGYIRNSLPLNGLCRDLRAAMSLAPDAGGIEIHIGKLLAAKFQQYAIAPGQQQQLWHRVLKHADLTASFVRALLDKIGPAVAQSEKTGMLFSIPASVETALTDMRDRAEMIRRAQRGLAWLLQCKDSGILDELADLKKLLDRKGQTYLNSIKSKTASDAALIGRLCYAPA